MLFFCQWCYQDAKVTSSTKENISCNLLVMAVLQINPGQRVPLDFLFPLFPEENLWGLMSRGFLPVRCPCSVPQPHWRKHKALFQPVARTQPFFIHHRELVRLCQTLVPLPYDTRPRQHSTAEKATDTNSYKSTFWSHSIPRTRVQQQQSIYVWSCFLNLTCFIDADLTTFLWASVVS